MQIAPPMKNILLALSIISTSKQFQEMKNLRKSFPNFLHSSHALRCVAAYLCAEHGANLAGASPVTGIYRQV